MPLPQKALPPAVPGYTDITPERIGTDLGMETTYKYTPNDYECVKSAILCVKWDGLVNLAGFVPAPPATYGARYPSDVLCHSIEKIQFQVGGLTVQELSGDEIHFKQEVESPAEEYSRIIDAQKIDSSVANRATLATAAFWTYLEVPFWFADTSAKAWHQYACQRQTRIVIKWRPLTYVLQTDDNIHAGPPAPLPLAGGTYILDQFFRFRISALDTDTKDVYTTSVKGMGQNGLNYMTQFSQKQDYTIVLAGVSSKSINLLNFNKPTYMLRFVNRLELDLQPDFTRNNRWLVQDIAYYYEDASGHRVWPRMSSDFAKIEVNGKVFLGQTQPRTNIFHVLHTDYPDVTQYPMGCLEYAKLNNPTLNIEYTGILGGSMIVDVWAYCYDYLRLVITQDNRSTVTLEQPM